MLKEEHTSMVGIRLKLKSWTCKIYSKMTNIFSVDRNAFEIYWRNKPALVERFACEYVGSKNVALFATVDVTSGKYRLID